MAVQPRAQLKPPVPVIADRAAASPQAEPKPARAWGVVGVGVLSLACAAFVFWLYAFPPRSYGVIAGLNPAAVTQFRAHLPFFSAVPVRAALWSSGFRILLGALWAVYGLTVWAALRGGAPRVRHTAAVMGAVSLGMAVLCPPLLTTDCYSYVSYAHLHVFYGLNPYLTTAQPLVAHHDPIVRFLYWNLPSVYGPVWTGLSDLIVCLTPHSLWGQIVLIKTVEAAALCGAALVGARLAEQFRPGWGRVTLLAIGLNPLLLIEGPGSGHNDLLMMALALGGVWLFRQKRPGPAGLLLGLSVGVKMVPLALVPWLIITLLRRDTGRENIRASLALLGGLLTPLLIGYAVFWQGPQTLTALHQRSLYEADPALRAHLARVGAWWIQHGASPAVASLCVAFSARAKALLVYACLSLWLWRTRARPGAEANELTAWTVFAPCLMFLGMGNPFPWYIAWFWPVSLLRWNRFSLGLSIFFFLLSLVWESFYAVLRPF